VLGSNIKHIPIAGRKITKFIMDSIKDRNENISTQDLYFAAMEIKEKHGYLTKDIVEEFCKWDEKIIDDVTKKYTMGPIFKKYQGIGKTTNSQINIDLGYEIFLGPESFFAPVIYFIIY
jgi:actin-related protein 3